MTETTPAKPKNLHNFKFGKTITKKDITNYLKQIYGNKYRLTNISYDSHYWWSDVTETDTKKKAFKVRMDYFLAYERVPRALK